MELDKEVYLGDGLYASFDGWQIRLRAPREREDHVVYLDASTLIAFEKFIAELRKAPQNDDSSGVVDQGNEP